ncbi:protein YhfH [Rossellomorea sp. BNER]|jgi:ribosomal protein L37AE/L43A|nr:YhfH family protein [Rossellomorea sp. BNER]
MLNLDFYRNLPKKECRECGSEIKEQHESYLYECEHCIGKYEQ